MKAKKDEGSLVGFKAAVRIDTPIEVEYYRNGETAKRAYSVEETGQSGVSKKLPKA